MVLADMPEGGCRRIKNAAKRIGRNIYVVGSRANDSYGPQSDFDYVIPSINRRDWRRIKNSLPGSKNSNEDNPSRIDLFKGEVDISRPYITITSNPDIDECR